MSDKFLPLSYVMPKHNLRILQRIVSGGQTGVDRAALDVAIELGIPHGGWCPRGRLAEDGPIDARYELVEMPTADYAARTEQNVIDSSGTLVLHAGDLSGGTNLTVKLALRHRRPCHVVNLAAEPSLPGVLRWIEHNAITTLNIAGPRESSSPRIYDAARAFLSECFSARAAKE